MMRTYVSSISINLSLVIFIFVAILWHVLDRIQTKDVYFFCSQPLVSILGNVGYYSLCWFLKHILGLSKGCFIRNLGDDIKYLTLHYIFTDIRRVQYFPYSISSQYFLAFFSQAYQFQFLDLNASLCKGDEDDSEDSASFSDGEVNST